MGTLVYGNTSFEFDDVKLAKTSTALWEVLRKVDGPVVLQLNEDHGMHELLVGTGVLLRFWYEHDVELDEETLAYIGSLIDEFVKHRRVLALA